MIIRKLAKFYLLLLFTTLFSVHDASAQSQEKVYAAMMVNFARSIQWPEYDEDHFTIGVLEYVPLFSELSNSVKNMKVGSKPVVIKQFPSADEINDCQMLFIPAYKMRSFSEIAMNLESKSTLIITNKMGYAKKGSGINFILVEGKLKYEINCKSLETRGMKIPIAIKNLGILVE